MNGPSDQDEPFVVAAFLQRLLADRDDGEVGPLTHYQTIFPGHPDVIEREYRALLGDEDAGEADPSPTAGDPQADPSSALDTLDAFREQYRKDRAEGTARPLHEYLALFPGHDSVLAGEFLRLENAGSGLRPLEASERIGPYRIQRELGRGGQGTVYLAEDTRLRRMVALKVVPQFDPDAADQLARIEREAMVASRLNDPGICKVFECGFHGRVAYIAMERVVGETLTREVASRRTTLRDDESDSGGAQPNASIEDGQALPDRDGIRRILKIVERTARALNAAHEAGVIHRDIKPGNIMVTDGDRPVILDFGLAREVDGDLRTLTRTGDFFGTPFYMAPEQLAVEHGRPDHRADIWALGVCLHECLTLRRPFEEATRERLYRAILTREPARARTLNPLVSRDVEVIIATALQKDRDDRYQSARVLADDLRAAREGRPISARSASRAARAWRWARRRPAAGALLLVLTLGVPVLAGLGGFVIANLPRWEEQRRREDRRAHEALMAEALHRLLQWNFPKAIDSFREGLKRQPDSAEARGGLALVYLRSRRPRDALHALDEDPAAVRGSHGLARIRVDALGDLGRIEDARELEAALPPARVHTDYFLLGLRTLIRMEVNRRFTPGEAFDLFTLADELYPHEPRIIYYFTRVLAALSEGDRRHAAAARRVAEVMAKRWPDHHLTWYARGTSASDDRIAVEHLTKCLELRPDFVGAYAHLSYRVVSLDAERALGYADQALERAPEWPWAYAMKARALRGLRRYGEALAVLEQGIRLSPRDPVLVIQRGRIHVAAGDATRAEEAFREAIRLNPEFSESHTWLGFALTQAKRYDAALAAHLTAIALAPDRPWPIVQLGRTLYVKGDLSGAIERFTSAVELDSTYVRAYLYRGLARRRNGDPQGALADFQKILAFRPDDRRARIEVERTEQLLKEAEGKPDR